LTNIALAVSIDPEFAALTQGLVVMGGSLNPQTDDPEFAPARATSSTSGSIPKRHISRCVPRGRAST